MKSGKEVYQAVLQEINKANTRSMTPEEFNYHVKIGQLEWLKMRYWGFDKHQKTISDLQPIILISDLSVVGIIEDGQVVGLSEDFVLPDDYLYTLQVKFKCHYLEDDCYEDGTFFGNLVAKYRLHNLSDNPYHKGNNQKIYYQEWGGNIRRIKGDDTIKAINCNLSYLRYPANIEVDTAGENVQASEFGTMQNIEIAKWTAASYLENIESMRTRSMLAIQGQVFTHQKNVQ